MGRRQGRGGRSRQLSSFPPFRPGGVAPAAPGQRRGRTGGRGGPEAAGDRGRARGALRGERRPGRSPPAARGWGAFRRAPRLALRGAALPSAPFSRGFPPPALRPGSSACSGFLGRDVFADYFGTALIGRWRFQIGGKEETLTFGLHPEVIPPTRETSLW